MSSLLRLAPSVRIVAELLFLAELFACAMPQPSDATSSGPYALVLGTAQDGGLPQIGCDDERCRRARRDPAQARLVSSLLLVDPRARKRFLIDATPDLPRQIELARGHPGDRVHAGPRPPLVDGILLTHAHVGHYAGLLHLGREVYGSQTTPVLCSARMAAFLSENAPWSLLVETGAIELRVLEPDVPVSLTDDLAVTPILVPHRDEFSDTFAFLVRGPERSLLYLPDIDKWEHWERRIEELLAQVDVAFLDGTFYDAGELPGRDMAEIPHPFIVESIERFRGLPQSERAKLRFLHLNHTNPAADPATAAAASVRAAGMAIAREGDVHRL